MTVSLPEPNDPATKDVWGPILNAAIEAVNAATQAALEQIDIKVAAAIQTHLEAENPHPQYALMTGDAAGARIVGVTGPLPEVDGVNIRDGDYVIQQAGS